MVAPPQIGTLVLAEIFIDMPVGVGGGVVHGTFSEYCDHEISLTPLHFMLLLIIVAAQLQQENVQFAQGPSISPL